MVYFIRVITVLYLFKVIISFSPNFHSEMGKKSPVRLLLSFFLIQNYSTYRILTACKTIVYVV